VLATLWGGLEREQGTWEGQGGGLPDAPPTGHVAHLTISAPSQHDPGSTGTGKMSRGFLLPRTRDGEANPETPRRLTGAGWEALCLSHIKALRGKDSQSWAMVSLMLLASLSW
jgi:hypothetical protein